MFKYFFRMFFIVVLYLPVTVCAQTADTVASMNDSLNVQTDSSRSDGDSFDAVYKPISDSGHLKEYSLRAVPQAVVNKYLAGRDYEYANDPEYWREKKSQNIFSSKLVQWTFFIGLIALVMYAIFLLVRENNFKWFSRKNETAQTVESDSVVNGYIDYDQKIVQYQAEGNYRFAVRYLYLRLLQFLSEKNIISIRDSMTNAEIERAFSRHSMASQFRYLATAYEYIFFGDYNMNKEVFDTLKTKFDAFEQKLKT